MNDTSSHHEHKANREHEADAVNPRIVISSIAGLVVLVASVLLLMLGTFGVLKHETGITVSQAPKFQQSPSAPGPKLTPDQSQQLQQLRQAETHRLNTYGWSDEAAGIARIPIARAIELLAEQGLTTVPPSSQPPDDAPSE